MAIILSRLRIVAVLSAMLPLCGCLSRDLQTGLSEQEAQSIIVVLKQNGLDAYPVREQSTDRNAAPKWTVKVRGGGSNLVQAWQVLQENGLPRQKTKGLQEVFSNPGIIPTASEEKARMLLALSGEMAETLKSVAGVVDARVQLVLPENSPLLEKSQWNPTTASVLVKHRGSPPPLSDDEVRRLVAKGVEGLQPENVAVVFKQVAVAAQAPRGAFWYLSDAYVVAAALTLMILASFGSLLLLFRSRRQLARIRSLESELAAATARPQLSTEAAARG